MRLPGEAETGAPVLPKGGEPGLARYGGLDLPAEPFGETPVIPASSLSGVARVSEVLRRRRELGPLVERLSGEVLGRSGLSALSGGGSGARVRGGVGLGGAPGGCASGLREGPALGHLAALHWAVGTCRGQSPGPSWWRIEVDLRREVRAAGLAGAREAAARPDLRELLDAAVRGDDAAQARVLARNPELGHAATAARRLSGAPSVHLAQSLAALGSEPSLDP